MVISLGIFSVAMINLSDLGILALLHHPLINFTALSLNIYSAYVLVATV